MEVGETFEDAVHREVFEETGIRIKIFAISVANLGHSQIHKWWVLADYDSGDIQLQETELHDAQWFLVLPLARITANRYYRTQIN